MGLPKCKLLLPLVICITLSAADNPSMFQIRRVAAGPGDAAEQLAFTSPDGQNTTLPVQREPFLDLSDVESATVVPKSVTEGDPQVRVWLTQHGRQRLEELTGQSLHQRIAVVIEGKVWSAPVIQAKLTGPYIPIQAHITDQEAQELAARINVAVKKQ
jgi:preprotein translocase subunit SecD